MKFEQYEYEIGAHFLSALINADPSGLSATEVHALDVWEATVRTSHGCPGTAHWAVLDDSDEFGTCDATGLRGQTERVAYMVAVPD